MTSPATLERVCPDDHRHDAAVTCYIIHKCRCLNCKTANTSRERRRAKLKAYGRWESPYVDAQPAREHVLALRASGIGYKSIATLAGVSITAVRALIYGREDYQNGGHGPRHGEPIKRITREKAERLLALQPTVEQLPRTAHRPARGTVRRVQALVAIGWSVSAIAEHAGVDYGALCRTMRRHSTARTRSSVLVRPATIVAIERTYSQLSSTPPPETTHHERLTASRMRNLAARNGWPVPMDWESIDNDFDRVIPVRRSAPSRFSEVAS